MKRRLLTILLIIFPFFHGFAQNLDIDILRALNGPYEHDLSFWMDVTKSAYLIPSAYVATNITLGFVNHDKKKKRYALETAIGLATSTLLTHGLKFIVNRPRPAETYPDIIRTYSKSNDQSFPSGHTSLAFAAATTMYYQWDHKWYVVVPAGIWASSVGYSRMRLGKHYPSDVLVGAVVGIGSGVLSHWLVNKITHSGNEGK
jgi:membrane-associated phospholipid phosphatase